MQNRLQAILDRLRQLWDDFLARLRVHFLLRWVVATAAGWSVGLYLGVWSASLLTICLGGAFTGLLLGWLQWWALKLPHPLAPSLYDVEGEQIQEGWPFNGEGENAAALSPIMVGRDWIGLTAAGALVGALPAMGMGITVLLSWGVGTAVVGAIIGAGVGAAQWFILQRGMSRAAWWIAANAASGGLCALFTLAPILRGLPIGLLVGTVIYGYITGRVLLWLSRDELKGES